MKRRRSSRPAVPTSLAELRSRLIVFLLILTLGPTMLLLTGRAIERYLLPFLLPVLPWALAVVIILGLYRLVIRRYRR